MRQSQTGGSSDATDFASQFEYVMVFPYKDGKESDFSRFTCQLLLKAGLELFPYLSVQKDELIVLITCKDEVLKAFADVIDVDIELNPPIARKRRRFENLCKSLVVVYGFLACSFQRRVIMIP